MKLKLSVLALLFVGLVFTSSAFAQDVLTVELVAQNNAAYAMDVGQAWEGVPMLILDIDNLEVGAVTITALSIETGLATTAIAAEVEERLT